jgi:hypothetical protein
VAGAASVVLGLALAGCATSDGRPAGSLDSAGAPSWTTSASTPATSSTSSTPSVSASASPSPSSASPSSPPASGATPGPAASDELPRGGTQLFPHYRLVGYAGGEGSAAFGRLGIGNLDARVDEIEKLGAKYTRGGRQPLPVLELIAVVVQAHPGADGKYRVRVADSVIQRYLDAARRHRALLLLNIQPGRADFLPEVQALSKWLAYPDVGVALDPEWAVGPKQVPGQVFGHTTSTEINGVASWLSQFTRDHDLPDKAMVVHQLATRIISNAGKLRHYSDVEDILSVDGIGNRTDKTDTWKKLVKPLPKSVIPGFKLFFDEDRRHGRLMTPSQVMALKPTPEYVLYE